MVAAEHVDHEKIIQAIPVDIREIDAHGEQTGFANGQRRCRPKPTLPIVEPDPVFGVKIIADVKIGKRVPVHVAEHGVQAPFKQRLLERSPRGVQKTAPGEGHEHKVGAALIAIERIRFTQFLDTPALRHDEPILQIRFGDRPRL